MTNQCQHGQLARVCLTCEKDAEIAALRAELVSTNERWEKSHQIALAIQDERDALRVEVAGLRERDALRERVRVLEDALRGLVGAAEDDSADRWEAAIDVARAALEQKT